MRKETAKNVFLTEIEGRYRKSRISVYLASPLRRDNITSTAMLPFLLERGTDKLPDMTLLKRRQNALYGASLTTDYAYAGFSRVLEGTIQGVDGRLVGEPGTLEAQRTALLLDVLFHPRVEAGAFLEEWVDIEREKLRDTIRSVVNDKRDYCDKLVTEAFFADDERSLPSEGYEADLDGITGEGAYAAYRDLLAHSSVEIIAAGSGSAESAAAVAAELAALSLGGGAPRALTPVPKKPETAIVREMDVEQDKLAFALTAGRLMTETELVALRVANGIYGASPVSRLFLNVREKQSLCYAVGSQVSYRAGGGMFIECGVDRKNAKQAREAVWRELRGLAEQGPSDEELARIKLLYQNLLGGVSDNCAALCNYYYGNLIRYGRPVTPDEEMAMIERVTAGDVMAALADLHINASCHITRKEGGA